jgi:hypothetical protein
MFLAVIVVVGLVALLASLVYLLDFARASRGDNLYLPATSGRARRARLVTGMYTRGAESPRDDEITFVARPYHDQLAAH